MSYCRRGSHSHVYVIQVAGPCWWCVDCDLSGRSTHCDSPAEMHAHLLGHRVARHAVPQDALDALAAEITGAP